MVVVIATPLEAELVTTIKAVDDRLEVLFDPKLLPPLRFPCDHRGCEARRWEHYPVAELADALFSCQSGGFEHHLAVARA